MNEREMNEALDARLARLQGEVAPRLDLWPAIAARIAGADEVEARKEPEHRSGGAWRQLAAAAVLVTLSSLTTYWVMMTRGGPAPEQIVATQLVQEQLAAQFMPVGYVKARAELSVAFEDSLSRLSPATRRVVEANLDDIERSLKEISAALARDPGNTALQQLLVAASTQELQYLDEVRRLALNIPSTGA